MRFKYKIPPFVFGVSIGLLAGIAFCFPDASLLLSQTLEPLVIPLCKKASLTLVSDAFLHNIFFSEPLLYFEPNAGSITFNSAEYRRPMKGEATNSRILVSNRFTTWAEVVR